MPFATKMGKIDDIYKTESITVEIVHSAYTPQIILCFSNVMFENDRVLIPGSRTLI